MRKESMQMRAAGAWDILNDAINNFSLNSDGNQAAAIALYAILSVIPLFILTLIAAGSLFSSNPTIQTDIIGAFRVFIPISPKHFSSNWGKSKARARFWDGSASWASSGCRPRFSTRSNQR